MHKTDFKPRTVELHGLFHYNSFISPKEDACPRCKKWLQCRPAPVLIDFYRRLFTTPERFMYSVSSCISLGIEVNN